MRYLLLHVLHVLSLITAFPEVVLFYGVRVY